jgi:hypothetical protein
MAWFAPRAPGARLRRAPAASLGDAIDAADNDAALSGLPRPAAALR